MKRIPILTTLLLSLLALAACQKTDDAAPDGMVEIFAESMNGGDKVVLDGLSATWRSGDAIRINGSTATVERCGDHAYISNASISEGTNRALYPASLSTVNWGTDNPVVTLPAYYHYRTDSSGHQVLDLPMAAYSNSRTSPLQFKHLTGALYVTVKNTGATARTLQSVTVRSNTYALSGTLRVALNTDSLVAASTTGTADDRAVTLVFDKVVTLANGESVRVMIPVRPVRSDNNFTIEVKSYASGQQSSYLSSKTQPSGSDHSLARNELGYAPMNIPVGETPTPVLTLNADKYEIYTPYDFKLMTDAIEGNWFRNNDAKYYIMEDIDMTDISITTINNDLFGGWIIGNNHTVSNLTINGIEVAGNVYCALFKMFLPKTVIRDITIDGLSLVNQSVGTSPLYVGAFEAYNSTSNSLPRVFTNCTVNISNFVDGSPTGDVYFGGLSGCLESSPLEFSNCHVTTSGFTVHGNNIYIGGLVGYNGNKKASISSSSWESESNITIDANNNVRAGGLIGYKTLHSFAVTNCTVSGRMVVTANGTYRYVGSLIGQYGAQPSANLSGDITTDAFTASMNGVELQSINYFGN